MNSSFANLIWISNLKNNFLNMISYYLLFIFIFTSSCLRLTGTLANTLIGDTSVLLTPILFVLIDGGIYEVDDTLVKVGSFFYDLYY